MIVVCSWQELEARWLAGNISVLVASLAAETHCQFSAWPERVSEMVASLSVETDSVQVSEGRGLGNWLSTITIAGSRNTRDSSRMHVPCLGIILLRKQSGKPYRTISKYNVFLLQRQHIGSLVVHARAIAHSRACRIREPVAFESLSHSRACRIEPSCIREPVASS